LPTTLGSALDVDGAEPWAFRLQLAALHERAEAAVEAMRSNDDVVSPATLVVTWPDADDPTAAAEIDHQLRSLAATLAMRDIELGELAGAIVDYEAWRTFGYASSTTTARVEGGSPCTFAPPDAGTRNAVDDIECSVIAAVTGLTEMPASQTSGDLSAPAPERDRRPSICH